MQIPSVKEARVYTTNQSLEANWMPVHELQFLHLQGTLASGFLLLACNIYWNKIYSRATWNGKKK